MLPRPYGIRVRLRPRDPFAKLLGADWQKTHWFFTAAERDRVLEDMARKHEYSRIGDQPALVFEKVENLAESRGILGKAVAQNHRGTIVGRVADVVVAAAQVQGPEQRVEAEKQRRILVR